MIAVTLVNPRHLSAANRTKADLLEIRTDLYTRVNMNRLLDQSTKPVILTIKTPRSVWLDYIDHPNVRYVDIDYRLSSLIAQFHHDHPQRVQLIVSYHDFKETPSWAVLQKVIATLRKHKPDVLKIATMVNQFDDVHTVMRLQKQYGKKIIAVGMGDLGIMTRVYNRGLLTYGRLNLQDDGAPGQVQVDTMRTMRVYGLVGDNIQYSLSPLMYNTSFAHYDMPHTYQLWDTSHFDKFAEVFSFFTLPGASVTQPYKEQALTLVDTLDVHAKKIGAVNVLVRQKNNKENNKKNNRIAGYNTDWLGAQGALRGELKNKKVLILGAGGASAAIQYAAQQAGAQSVKALHRKDMPTDEDDYDVLINATPVYDMVLVPEDSLYGKVVMDTNYGAKTELVKHAEKFARKTIGGLSMLLEQGIPQFTLWTGKNMPVAEVQKKLIQNQII